MFEQDAQFFVAAEESGFHPFRIRARTNVNDGIRIDHLMLSPQAADRLVATGIDRFTRAWEKPSDHVPAWIDLDLEARDASASAAPPF